MALQFRDGGDGLGEAVAEFRQFEVLRVARLIGDLIDDLVEFALAFLCRLFTALDLQCGDVTDRREP